MCGIAGVSAHGIGIDAARRAVDRALGLLRDRGPEGSRCVDIGDVGCFGHTALPLARRAVPQPFRTRSGRLTVTFNGQLFNVDDLAARLPAATRDACAGCDTAVAAELIEVHGSRVVEDFRGMFALAIWDHVDERLELVRDRLGKKPLYYWFGTDSSTVEWAFASELDALLEALGRPFAVDVTRLPAYLSARAVAAPDTLVEGIRKVGPGQVVTVDRRGYNVFWLPNPAASTEAPEPDALATTLARAVDRRLATTDDLVGVLFSGGVDSTLVAALANDGGRRGIPAFSVALSQEEGDWIRGLAATMGLESRVWTPSLAELGRAAEAALDDIDEPIGDPSLVVTRMAARLASEHVRVVLTGDGSDELFFGYRYFEALTVLKRLEWAPAALTSAAFRVLGSPVARALGLPLANHASDLATCVGMPAHAGFQVSHSGGTPGVLAALLSEPDDVAFQRGRRGMPVHVSLEQARSSIFWHFLVDLVITKVDRSTMAFGVEARSPFLDEEVVALGLSLTPHQCRSGSVGKVPIRRMVATLCGPSAARRPKLGFRSPTADLLRGPLRDRVHDLLCAPSLRDSFYWNHQLISRAVREHDTGVREWTQVIWTVLVFESWLARQRQHSRIR